MTSNPKISAFIPCFNNADSIRDAIEGIQTQTSAVDEIFVIDDGSTDHSVDLVRSLGVQVLTHERNLGRGAVRARAMQYASHELVLNCDATIQLHPEFLERALRWFESDTVSAVFGRLQQRSQKTVADRWRGRHLLKTAGEQALNRRAYLFTGGVLLRKSAVLDAGNFNTSLRHSEDLDLGTRLLERNYEVVFDPSITVFVLASNTVSQVLERYWRWNSGKDEKTTWIGYWRHVVYAVKWMMWEDLRTVDVPSAFISFICPHYCFWKSRMRSSRAEAC